MHACHHPDQHATAPPCAHKSHHTHKMRHRHPRYGAWPPRRSSEVKVPTTREELGVLGS